MGVLASLLPLCACATGPKLKPREHGPDYGEAATQPLQDLNIQKVEIPPVLRAAVTAPYRPAPRDCAGIAREIAELDAVLGNDLDREPLKPDQVGEIMEGAVRDAAGGWIPFRSILRRMTGAAAHSRKVELAITAGAVRRGYLKGVGERSGCKPPAAPLRAAAATKPAPR